MTPWVALVVGVLVVLALTLATGYFVAQEFAFMAVDRSRLEGKASRGDQRAVRTLDITRRTSFMLSGAQLGITVTGLLVGYVAEPLIGESLATLVGGGLAPGAAVLLGGLAALVFSTLVQMLLGELFPKNYAIARADRVAAALTGSTRWYLLVFGPLIWVFDKAAEAFLRLLRIEPVHDVEHAASARDLEKVVEASRDSGDLSAELSLLLERILDFPSRDVGHAMVGRARTDVVRVDATVAQVRGRMVEGHTRYPVLDDEENIIGVVDLADVMAAPRDTEPVTSITREALVLAEAMGLSDALAAMHDADAQLACVVDEFGSFVGVLTMEDLAEEVVGDIVDEHDTGKPAWAVPDGDTWLVPGDLPIDEVERALDVELPAGDYETIAGLVIEVFGRLPAVGESVSVDLPVHVADLLHDDDATAGRLRAEVVRIEHHVPSEVRLSLEGDESGEVRA